tara:strand:+ start:45510 stop:46325 length:816 start_codon:yes stop_codon:yes gene_type:complete
MEELYDLWTSLPATITKYDPDTQEATVLPLAKLRWIDNSQTEFPEIDNVPVVCPATAYAAIQFPVRVGDKVLLMFQSRDISWTLSNTDTSGLDPVDPNLLKNDSGRFNELSDAVALIGFSSFSAAHGTSKDLHIFNNTEIAKEDQDEVAELGQQAVTGGATTQEDEEEKEPPTNHIILKEDGEVELSNPWSSVIMSAKDEDDDESIALITLKTEGNVIVEAEGSINLKAEKEVTINAPLTTVVGALTVTEDINSGGRISAPAVGGALVHPS